MAVNIESGIYGLWVKTEINGEIWYRPLSGCGGSGGGGSVTDLTEEEIASLKQTLGVPSLPLSVENGGTGVDNVKGIISELNIPEVKYPITIDKGGTGATTVAAAKTALGVPVLPLAINQGGTGATTAAAAKTALGITDVAYPIPVDKGGTGATSLAAAKTALGIPALPLPIASGGTGANSVAAAKTALGIPALPLSVANGGTGANSVAAAKTALGIPALPLSVANGGTGANSVAAAKTSLGITPQLTIYVGGTGASDTVSSGRGLSASVPFATLAAAHNWVLGNTTARRIAYKCTGNIPAPSSNEFSLYDADAIYISAAAAGATLNAKMVHCGCPVVSISGMILNMSGADIAGWRFLRGCYAELADTTMNITTGRGYEVAMGSIVEARNIVVNCTSAVSAFFVYGFGRVYAYGTLKFTGKVSDSVFHLDAGHVYLACGTDADFSGSVTGRKYTAIRHSSLYSTRDLSRIPGTVSGTKDGYSTAFAGV